MTVTNDPRRTVPDTAFLHAPTFMAVLSPDGRIVAANHAALAFARLPAEQAHDTLLCDSPGWRQHPRLVSWLEAQLNLPDPPDGATHVESVVAAGGGPAALRFTLRIPNRSGATVHRYLYASDATSERRHRDVFETSAAIQLIVADHDGAVLAVNPAAEQFYGWTRDSMRSLYITDLDDTPFAVWREHVSPVASSPVPSYSTSHRVRDGKQRQVLVATSPMDFDGREAHHLIIHDVSERWRAEIRLTDSEARFRAVINAMHEGVVVHDASGAIRAFNVTADQALQRRLHQAQQLEATTHLVGGIAHDFNNLLTIIRGAAGFLRDALDADSPMHEDVDAIERASGRAEALTRSLLTIGRRHVVRAESIDLRALVQDQFPGIRASIPAEIEVVIDLGVVAVRANLDAQRVLDALRALTDNARQAMPGGGTLRLAVREQVRLHAAHTGNAPLPRAWAVLEVSDNGTGMNETDRARLLERVFPLPETDTGQGLGLATVSGVVARHHGFIECDATPGEGTTVRLCFPPAVDDARDDA